MNPIFTIRTDAIRNEFLHPYISYLTYQLMDEVEFSEATYLLLEKCAEQILRDRSFDRNTNYSARTYGKDLNPILKDLFFISVEQADLAVRFANGDWTDIAYILPLVDKVVQKAGWIPDVMHYFLQLCERSGANYPAKTFADQILNILTEHEGHLKHWQGLSLLGRIAERIQFYAEANHPLPQQLAQTMLRILDYLVDMGDRRSSALQLSVNFKDIRL